MPPRVSRFRAVRIPSVDAHHGFAVVKPCRGAQKHFPVGGLRIQLPHSAFGQPPQHFIHLKDGGDFLRDGESARVVHPSSAHLSRAIIELIDDTARRADIAERGRAIARSFTVARSAEGYERLFLESIAARPLRRERVAR